MVLVDTGFGSVKFIQGVRKKKYHIIAGIARTRKLTDGRCVAQLHKRGQQLYLQGLKFPVFVSCQLSSTVVTLPVEANSVAEGVINLVKTEGYDVVVLGASHEGLLQQAIQGNIPEAIASGVESTVILVRGAINS
ncbi:universal stress protein [Nostoc sp. UHCC 0926]|nr:universal stress protein [Nostoc sp. UHCC 0926]